VDIVVDVCHCSGVAADNDTIDASPGGTAADGLITSRNASAAAYPLRKYANTQYAGSPLRSAWSASSVADDDSCRRSSSGDTDDDDDNDDGDDGDDDDDDDDVVNAADTDDKDDADVDAEAFLSSHASASAHEAFASLASSPTASHAVSGVASKDGDSVVDGGNVVVGGDENSSPRCIFSANTSWHCAKAASDDASNCRDATCSEELRDEHGPG
jgi:hypothetical protein